MMYQKFFLNTIISWHTPVVASVIFLKVGQTSVSLYMKDYVDLEILISSKKSKLSIFGFRRILLDALSSSFRNKSVFFQNALVNVGKWEFFSGTKLAGNNGYTFKVTHLQLLQADGYEKVTYWYGYLKVNPFNRVSRQLVWTLGSIVCLF